MKVKKTIRDMSGFRKPWEGYRKDLKIILELQVSSSSVLASFCSINRSARFIYQIVKNHLRGMLNHKKSDVTQGDKSFVKQEGNEECQGNFSFLQRS